MARIIPWANDTALRMGIHVIGDDGRQWMLGWRIGDADITVEELIDRESNSWVEVDMLRAPLEPASGGETFWRKLVREAMKAYVRNTLRVNV